MRSFTQGLIMVALFVAGNIVAAGVVLILGMILKKMAPDLDSPWPWFVVCAAAAAAAVLFLKGAFVYANERSRLQCRARQRGGKGNHGAD